MPARILLVDDETALLNLMESFLKRLGYTVAKSERGGEALELFNASPEEYDVVVADLTLPDMAGQDMAQRMVARNPGIRILLSSGYPFELASLPAAIRPRFAVLQKPYLPKMLVSAVEELMKLA